MSTPLSADKAALRREFEARRNSVTADVRRPSDVALLNNLFASDAWQAADTILSYVSVRGEIDLSPVWKKAVADGKRVALPRTVTGASEGQMVFQFVEQPSDLMAGRYGLKEPSPACPEVTDFARTLCLVPGLSFDRHGYRLGYGGGYYDRFLANHPPVVPVGLCYEVCLSDALPHDRYDIPVSYIFTEGSVIACVPQIG